MAFCNFYCLFFILAYSSLASLFFIIIEYKRDEAKIKKPPLNPLLQQGGEYRGGK